MEGPSNKLSPQSRMALVRAKIERAHKNLIDMERSLQLFHGSVPGPERSIKAKTAPWGATIVFTLPFDSLAAAGDVINNLRGSLDHLIYQLADSFDPKCSSDVLERIAFPIGEDLARFIRAKRRIVKFVHPGVIKLIDLIQPYKGGNDALWLLNKLNNISKHRMLLSVGNVVMCQADWVEEISLSNRFEYHVDEPHFDGIYAFPGNHDYVLGPGEKSIGNPNMMAGDAMLPTLHHMLQVVRDLVPRFLPYL